MSEINQSDEQKWQIPENLRVSTDETDARAFQRLQAAEAEQERLRAVFNVPDPTPKQRERANAVIMIGALENARMSQELTDEQIEQLAESYASIGEYEKAARLTRDEQRCREYEKYWEAVNLDDDDWCGHPEKHKFIKDYVYSVIEEKEMPLLACNFCGMWNVLDDVPAHLSEAQKKRAEIRQATKGMPMEQVKGYLNQRRFKD